MQIPNGLMFWHISLSVHLAILYSNIDVSNKPVCLHVPVRQVFASVLFFWEIGE